MVTQELIKYIGTQLQYGKTHEHIANILLKKGWSIEDIKLAFTVFKESAKRKEFIFNYNPPKNLNGKNKNVIVDQIESHDWYSKLFAFLPIILIVQGGIGILLGIINIIINLLLTRGNRLTILKIILILSLTIIFIGIYFVIDIYLIPTLPENPFFDYQKLLYELENSILNLNKRSDKL